MIEGIRLEDEGPDGHYLVLDGDMVEPFEKYLETETTTARLQVNDDVLRQLDEALIPWRAHMAEGERVRQSREMHKRAGMCGYWIAGAGPCMLTNGHEPADEHYTPYGARGTWETES